jgi:hypothetical protein
MTAESEANASRDHIFEIEMACLLAAMGCNVMMAEPDIVAEYDGHTWDVACKMSYSEKTFCDQIETGIGQALKQKGDRALVVVGLSSRIDHGPWPQMDTMSTQMEREIGDARAILHFNRDTRFFKGRENEKFRCVYLMLHGVTMIANIPAMLTVGAFVGREELFGDSKVLGEATLTHELNYTAWRVFAT